MRSMKRNPFSSQGYRWNYWTIWPNFQSRLPHYPYCLLGYSALRTISSSSLIQILVYELKKTQMHTYNELSDLKFNWFLMLEFGRSSDNFSSSMHAKFSGSCNIRGTISCSSSCSETIILVCLGLLPWLRVIGVTQYSISIAHYEPIPYHNPSPCHVKTRFQMAWCAYAWIVTSRDKDAFIWESTQHIWWFAADMQGDTLTLSRCFPSSNLSPMQRFVYSSVTNWP